MTVPVNSLILTFVSVFGTSPANNFLAWSASVASGEIVLVDFDNDVRVPGPGVVPVLGDFGPDNGIF